MFSIKPGPRNLPIDNPTLLSWNITDGDLNSKLNTLEYLNCVTNIINACGVYPQNLKDREIISTFHAEKIINDLLKNDYKISLFPDTTYRELNKAAQRSITAPDRIGEGKIWIYQRDIMNEREDNKGVHQYGPAEHFTHIISDKPSPKDKYVAYAINIPDYELAADVYNINVTSPSGQQETFKILINPEHLRQTLERKSLTAVQKSQCEIITPKKPGEAILHAFNATYQQIRENMSEFARCHYGYIQIPPVTTFRADGPETPEEEKGYWFHAYQPEDLCTIHNPMGDLQDFIALVKDAKKFGIDIIPGYTFNFMGIGGSGKNDLDYPSADIRAKISKDIEGGIPGYWQGQVLIPFIIDPVTKERKQIHPENIHLTAKDFEASKDNISKDEWENLHALKEKRLNGMPKTTPKSDQVIMLQNQYVREMRKYGVRGLRYDAAKHSKHEQIERSITPPLKNYNERLHNTNLFNPKYHEKAVMNYMEYLVTCQLDEQQMSSLLYERDDLSAIDFSLLMKTIKAFSFGGDLQTLASKPGSTISSIPSERRILININHDFPNNGNLFNDFLFNHQQDEQLAMAYMAALPFSRPLVYWDGQVLKSTTEIKNDDGSTRVGGEAWLNKGCSTYQQLYNEFHALYIDKEGIWSAFEGVFATKNILAFSRGDSVNINHSPHDGLVIINKGNEEIEGTWPNKLQPGIYKNMGSNSVNIIINNTRKSIPPGKVFTLKGGTLNINIPGRSALLLGKTGELPNYLYL